MKNAIDLLEARIKELQYAVNVLKGRDVELEIEGKDKTILKSGCKLYDVSKVERIIIRTTDGDNHFNSKNWRDISTSDDNKTLLIIE